MSKPNTIKIDDTEYVRADAVSEPDTLDGKPYVIVRSRNQGVMSGYLKAVHGQTVTLIRARQLYQWRSKFVLTDLAESGPVASGCRFSAEMSQPAVMLEACGILHCAQPAGEAIRAVPAQVK